MYVVKECEKCKEYKLLSEFHRKIAAPFGVGSACKACRNECDKQYRQQNKERISEQKKQHYQQNQERISEQQKQYRERNKERVYERTNKYAKQRKQTDPLFKMRCNLRTLIGNSIKKQGYTKSSRTYKILGCDLETFKKHIERQFTKGMTWNNHGEWHYDHVIPISSGQTEEELIKLNHYSNFQPLWAEDNRIKSNKIEPTQVKLRI